MPSPRTPPARARSLRESDALLAAAAGGCAAILLAAPLLQEPLVAKCAAGVVAALLGWALWRRWGPGTRG